MKAYRKKIV